MLSICSIELVMVWWYYCLLFVQVFAESFYFIWNINYHQPLMLFSAVNHILKRNLHARIRISAYRSSTLFYDRELTVIIYITKVFLLCKVNMFVLSSCNGLSGISWWIMFFHWLYLHKIKTRGAIICGFQYHYSYLFNKLICMLGIQFFISIWLTCSCCNACFCNASGIITCLPFSITQSITAISSQNIQYVLLSCGIWSLFSGQPLMLCSLSCCRCSPCEAACCSSCILM